MKWVASIKIHLRIGEDKAPIPPPSSSGPTLSPPSLPLKEKGGDHHPLKKNPKGLCSILLLSVVVGTVLALCCAKNPEACLRIWEPLVQLIIKVAEVFAS